jgi:hypothetical protein
VTVSGEPPVVESQPSGISTLIDERAINDLPLNGRRYTDLALLTPGVTQDPRGLTSSSNGDLAFGGIRGYQSSYLVDGGDNNNAFSGRPAAAIARPISFSNEVVQEFRVSSNTYGADQGRAGGAVVNVVTKSGSNRPAREPISISSRTAPWRPSIPSWISSRTISSSNSDLPWAAPSNATGHFSLPDSISKSFHVPAWCDFLTEAQSWSRRPPPDRPHPGDYEATDQALVFATAAQASKQAGTFPSSMLGNAGFFKLDLVLNQHNNLSLRLNTSRLLRA